MDLPADFRTPLGQFYHWEQTQPDVVWLRQCRQESDIVYTWCQAGKMARRLAAGLLSLGLQPGDRVGIYSENSAQWVIADLAMMMAGLVSVPIYATMPEDKIRYIVEHSEMKVMFVGKRCLLSPADLASSFAGSPVVVGVGGNYAWDDMLALASPLEGDPDWPLDRLWTLSYTSGTTGKPKGVMHSFSSAPYSAYKIQRMTNQTTASRFFSFLPLAHLAERVVVEMHSFYAGAPIGFNECQETFAEDLRRIRPTYFNAVPRIWTNLKAGIIQKLGEEQWQRACVDPEFGKQVGKPFVKALGLDDVVWAQAGSAPMPPDDIRAWHALGVPLVEGYAQTETMCGLMNKPNDFKIGTVGRILAPAKVAISEQGEILLSSRGNMLGYYRDPEKTNETLVDGWIHTGDKGVIDDDGFVTITGRVKDIFKTAKGKYVAPAPIEGEFAFIPGVAQCCLVGRGMPQTVLLLVPEPEIELSVVQLETHMDEINAKLEAHERMSHIIVCSEPWTPDNGLVTHTLKMLRTDIENRYQSLLDKTQTAQGSKILFETTSA